MNDLFRFKVNRLKNMIEAIHALEEDLQAEDEAEVLADNVSQYLVDDRQEDFQRLAALGKTELYHKEEDESGEDNTSVW